jgi:steroid delta-isomerase-like uncharacterized protein
MKRWLVCLPLVILMAFTLSCQDQQALAELGKMKAQAEVEEQNKALVKGLFDGLNNKNDEIIGELCAPDYAWYFPSNNPKPLSREEELEFVKLVWAGFPDINWNIEEIVAADDEVLTRFIATGTHQGEFQGIPATGNKIESSGIAIHRIVNGKIVEAREEADLLGMMQQLGMELRPAAVEE